MIVFSVCDESYYERFGKALAASAKANGLRSLIIKTGWVADTDARRAQASVTRYLMLPDLLKEHPEILMLDTDSIIRKPISFLDSWEVAFLVRPDLGIDANKKVNGSCVFITRRALDIAVDLQARLNGVRRWYDDQVQLHRIFRRDRETGKKRIKVIDPSLVSWRLAPEAAIWTGKGKVKSNPAFLAEVERRRGESHGDQAQW